MSSPIEQNHNLALTASEMLHDLATYQQLVGRLIYLSFTHMNLACDIHILSQFMITPCVDH